ncbi:hypothetical protein ACEPPU_24090 [Priestia aryabhattai]|uniref:hypothetical protein n=1 Tax=Priestia aryabhattai TaxID=412384 RepID=UPI0035AC0D0F
MEVPLNYSGQYPTSGRHKDDNTSNVVTDTVHQGSATKDATLISLDKATTGRGTPITVGMNKALRFEVWGSGTYAVQIEGIGKSGTPRALPVWDITNKTFVASNNITAAGFYEVDIQGFTSVQSNVTAVSGGNVNGSGVVIA